MSRLLALAALAAAVLSLAAPCHARIPINAPKDLRETLSCLAESGQYSRYLQMLRNSGFEAILAQYIEKNPVTLLVFPNSAIRKLPSQTRRQLKGAKLIKVLEYCMMTEIYPSKFIQKTLPTASFETVLGTQLLRAKSADTKVCAFKTRRNASAKDVFVITKGDACPPKRTVAVHIVSAVPIPPGLFTDVEST